MVLSSQAAGGIARIGPGFAQKKGVWNSSLNKCSSFERLKVPDTFFWAKPSGSQAGKARPARQASGAAANRSESIPVAVPWRRFYPCPVVEPGKKCRITRRATLAPHRAGKLGKLLAGRVARRGRYEQRPPTPGSVGHVSRK